MPELKPVVFIEVVRKIKQTALYDPRERALATFGLLLLALPKALSKVLPEVAKILAPVLTWIPLAGLLLLASAAVLIWRKVVAPVPDAGKPKPPAIKGPAPFGPHDAELFARLGRKDDLDRLRAWILDDQKPLVALMGESGVGKTSLLRAGLENYLKGDAVQVIYWEALPTDPEAGLLHAVQSRWEDSTTAPTSFARLASAVARGRRVVVIDQAEQLSPVRHRAIFEMLRQVATANPPYACTWVVAFRREYSSVWREFELDLPEPARHRLETLSLRRFLPEQAERVIAVLAEEGEVPIEQKVVKALVESIESEGRVTPADIGISLLVLSEISGDSKAAAFTVENFRERGGQAGLLTRYLERLLEQFPEAERREIFLGLLSLINSDNDQRLAEGRTPPELESLAHPASPPRFAAMLRFLSSGKARVLEQVPEPPLRYRLVHERLIPAIQRLTGVLGAEAEQAGRLLERAYRIWNRDQKARYLLSGRELRQVLKFRTKIAWGDEADKKWEYLRLSCQHRNRLRVLASIILTALGVGIYLYSEHRSHIAADRSLLISWGIPPDLLNHLQQLEELTMPKGVTRVDWLKEAHRLRKLTIGYTDLARLEGLPDGIHTLSVSLSPEPKELEELKLPSLPPDLQSFSIYGPSLKKIENIPENLTSLTLYCHADILDTVQIPAGVRKLELFLAQLPVDVLMRGDKPRTLDIRHLEHLSSLSIVGGNVFLLDDLEVATSVRSIYFDIPFSWQWLPADLESLKCSYCDPEPAFLPRNLKRLDLESHDNEAAIGKLVSTNNEVLSSLSIRIYEETFDLHQLPPGLRRLRLEIADSQMTRLGSLPKSLSILEIESMSNIIFSQGLPPSLRVLNFDEGQVALPELPRGLESLTYFGSLQSPLPASLRSLTLRINDKELAVLDPLWALSELRMRGEATKIPRSLSSLEHLDISYTEIRSLQGLPPSLISLTLRRGQVETLQGLPGSIKSLEFREAPSKKKSPF